MKRCPQCEFIYVDTDLVCDFDGSALVSVSENELGLGPIRRRRRLWVTRIIAALAAVIAGLAVVYAFYQGSQSRLSGYGKEPTVAVATPLPTTSPISAEPTPSIAPTPDATLRQLETAGERSKVSHGAVSRDPISTSGKVERGAATIYLQNGSRIEADEVWRTRQGVWYRRQGMVALIKASTVRSIKPK
jgi:hypothetical protein